MLILKCRNIRYT